MAANKPRKFRVFTQEHHDLSYSRLILLIDEESDENIGEIVRVCLNHIAGWDVVSTFVLNESLIPQLTVPPDAILFNSKLSCIHDLSFFQKQVIQGLKQHSLTQSSPILLMIDIADWLTAEQLQSLGVSGAILKPFDPILLSDQMSHILGWNEP